MNIMTEFKFDLQDVFKINSSIGPIANKIAASYGLVNELQDIMQEVYALLLKKKDKLLPIVVNQTVLNKVIAYAVINVCKELADQRNNPIYDPFHYYSRAWIGDHLDDLLHGRGMFPSFDYSQYIYFDGDEHSYSQIMELAGEQRWAEISDFNNAYQTLSEKQQLALYGMESSANKAKALDKLFVQMNKSHKEEK